MRTLFKSLLAGDLRRAGVYLREARHKTPKRRLKSIELDVVNETTAENAKDARDKKKRFSYKLKRVQPYRVELGQEVLRQAVDLAENVYEPRRWELYRIYKSIEKDLHLYSQMRTAFFKVIGEPAAIVDPVTAQIDADLTRLVQKEWFEEIGINKLAAEFYGHSVTEMGQMAPDEMFNNELVFTGASLFPREHISPEKGLILISPFDTEGIPFREPPFNRWLLEAGTTHDLGLFQASARNSIYKFFTFSDWSRSSEKWGDPILLLFSASDDESENEEKEKFAKNLGRNSYLITDIEDKAELLERQNGTNAHLIYKDFIEVLNQENSKGVNGQTATTDEKSFVGSAEVQERVLNVYTTSRLRRLYYYHNAVTLPYLVGVNNGNSAYRNLAGKIWVPLRYLEPVTLGEPGEDPPPPSENEPQNGPQNGPQNLQPRGGEPGKKYRYKMPSVMQSTRSTKVVRGRVIIPR